MFLQDSGWQKVKEREMKTVFSPYLFFSRSFFFFLYYCVTGHSFNLCGFKRPEWSSSATGRLEDSTVIGSGSPLASHTLATLYLAQAKEPKLGE